MAVLAGLLRMTPLLLQLLVMDTALATVLISRETTTNTWSNSRLDLISAKLHNRNQLLMVSPIQALKCNLPLHADHLQQRSTPNLQKLIPEPISDGWAPQTPMSTTFLKMISGVITRFAAQLLTL